MKKKVILALAIVFLALLVLIGSLVWLLIAAQGLGGRSGADPESTQQLQDYFREQWTNYSFHSYDAGTQTLILHYQVNATYDQVSRHGLSAGFDELAEGHLSTAVIIGYSCNQYCGVNPREIIIVGISSDGQEVYRASTVSGVVGCWESSGD